LYRVHTSFGFVLLTL